MTETTKPTLNFVIVCDDVRQEAGGKISLMGLFENVYAIRFPAFHPRLAIVTEWSGGLGDFAIGTRILAPDKQTVLRETTSLVKLALTGAKHRDVSVHLNLEFKAPGTYWIESLVDHERVNLVPLNVVHMKEQSIH